jgi:hypothetical protein
VTLLCIVRSELAQVAAFADASIAYIETRIDGVLAELNIDGTGATTAEKVGLIADASESSLALIDRLLYCELNDHNESGGRKVLRKPHQMKGNDPMSTLHPVSLLTEKLTRLLALSPADFKRVEALADGCLKSAGGQAALSGNDQEFAASQLSPDELKASRRLPGGAVEMLAAKKRHEAALVANENEATIPREKLVLLKILVGDDPIAIRDRWALLKSTAGGNIAMPAMPFAGGR